MYKIQKLSSSVRDQTHTAIKKLFVQVQRAIVCTEYRYCTCTCTCRTFQSYLYCTRQLVVSGTYIRSTTTTSNPVHLKA